MAGMRQTDRSLLVATVVLLAAVVVAGCATPVRSPMAPGSAKPASPTGAPSAPPASTPIETPTEAPELTPVPAAATPEPTRPTTTNTAWGAILDGVPEDFPVYPGASPVEVDPGPTSGAWEVDATVDEVAAWYRNALEEAGFTTQDLSSVLENGSRVLDTVSDLPECRIQTTFGPAGGSTIILVLYGAGCAGAGG